MPPVGKVAPLQVPVRTVLTVQGSMTSTVWLSAEKLLQYKVLYSAHSKCVACMSYYAGQPGLDKTCTSCGRNARQWAGCSVGDRKLKKVPIPDDVEEWLRAHNL